jgi:hypothetical protein
MALMNGPTRAGRRLQMCLTLKNESSIEQAGGARQAQERSKTDGPRECMGPDWSDGRHKNSSLALCTCSTEQCTGETIFHKTPYVLSYFDSK